MINFLSSLALVLGLLAVTYQLWQAQQLTRYELAVAMAANEQARFDNQIGEDISGAFAKLFTQSPSLTDQEVVQVLAFYDKYHAQVMQRRFFKEEGLFQFPWQFYVGADSSLICYYFNNTLGSYWMSTVAQDEIVTEMKAQVLSCQYDGEERINAALEAVSAASP